MNFKTAILSQVENGKEWLIIKSQSLVKNLNAEFVSGFPASRLAKKYEQKLGDGVNFEFEINHNLNSCSVVVSVFDVNSREMLTAGYRLFIITPAKIVIRFDSSPAFNQFNLTVIG